MRAAWRSAKTLRASDLRWGAVTGHLPIAERRPPGLRLEFRPQGLPGRLPAQVMYRRPRDSPLPRGFGEPWASHRLYPSRGRSSHLTANRCDPPGGSPPRLRAAYDGRGANTRCKEKDPRTTAEGPPHVRGDDGDEAGAGVPTERSGGDPEGAGAPAQRLGPRSLRRALAARPFLRARRCLFVGTRGSGVGTRSCAPRRGPRPGSSSATGLTHSRIGAGSLERALSSADASPARSAV
jgi:hypothetical protein